LFEVFFLLRIQPINRSNAKPFLAAAFTGVVSFWWIQYSPEEPNFRIVTALTFVFLVYGFFS